ncbi:protein odd-skipped-related 2 isoform X2 [Tachyglossus aculeatus]|uniref:protein odd-skipped-related 2 isoform X2 n=1 Tax=Tachyglossus aculeatus TaxID=9261 RepID=UPI0018F4447B|nr:protein odd-skipped-related 2 isoform X2 [Tachyglossus aculeatus]
MSRAIRGKQFGAEGARGCPPPPTLPVPAGSQEGRIGPALRPPRPGGPGHLAPLAPAREDGQQSVAGAHPAPPVAAADQLLVPAGGQHVPRGGGPPAGPVRAERGADHAHEPLDPGLPRRARAGPLHPERDGDGAGAGGCPLPLPGLALGGRAPVPREARRGGPRAPGPAQGKAALRLCPPGRGRHPGGPPEAGGPHQADPWPGRTPVGRRQADPGPEARPGPLALQDEKGVYLQVLRQTLYQILQPAHPRADPHRREALHLRHLPQGLPEAGSPARSQVYSFQRKTLQMSGMWERILSIQNSGSSQNLTHAGISTQMSHMWKNL